MIKNLIFDFGKVLVDYDYFVVVDRFFESHEVSEDFYHHLMDDMWNERLDREDRTFEQIISDMQQAMPQWKDEIRQFGDHYTEFVLGEIPGMYNLLVKLKAEGYKLYGLTNWCSKVYLTMAQFPIFQLLDGQIISSDEKVITPEPAIYLRLFDKFHIKPEECIFTDDKVENVEGGKRLGMDGIVFTDAIQYERELRARLGYY